MARRCFFGGGEEGCSLCFGNSVLCCLPKPSNEREGSRRMQLGGGRASLSICHDDMAVLSEFFQGGGERHSCSQQLMGYSQADTDRASQEKLQVQKRK